MSSATPSTSGSGSCLSQTLTAGNNHLHTDHSPLQQGRSPSVFGGGSSSASIASPPSLQHLAAAAARRATAPHSDGARSSTAGAGSSLQQEALLLQQTPRVLGDESLESTAAAPALAAGLFFSSRAGRDASCGGISAASSAGNFGSPLPYFLPGAAAAAHHHGLSHHGLYHHGSASALLGSGSAPGSCASSKPSSFRFGGGGGVSTPAALPTTFALKAVPHDSPATYVDASPLVTRGPCHPSAEYGYDDEENTHNNDDNADSPLSRENAARRNGGDGAALQSGPSSPLSAAAACGVDLMVHTAYLATAASGHNSSEAHSGSGLGRSVLGASTASTVAPHQNPSPENGQLASSTNGSSVTDVSQVVVNGVAFDPDVPPVLLGRGAFGAVYRVHLRFASGASAAVSATVSTAASPTSAAGVDQLQQQQQPPSFAVARKTIPLVAGVGSHGDTTSHAALRLELRVVKRIARLLHARATPMSTSRLELASPLLRIFAVQIGSTEAHIDMELLDAGPIGKYAPLPSEVCVAAVARQVLLGLQALHTEVRALHRDIKCANILCSRSGAVKLVDFGSAAMLPDGAPADASLEATDQQGTILQMSPERLRGEAHGPASDVWSFGVTIAELATGRHPFVPPEQAAGLASTERFWALAEVIRHTGTSEECAAATDAAVEAATATCSDLFQDFVRRAVRAEASQRATVAELLDHPFLRQRRNTLPPESSGAFVCDHDREVLCHLFSATSPQ